jgi:hypothetical protein
MSMRNWDAVVNREAHCATTMRFAVHFERRLCSQLHNAQCAGERLMWVAVRLRGAEIARVRSPASRGIIEEIRRWDSPLAGAMSTGIGNAP